MKRLFFWSIPVVLIAAALVAPMLVPAHGAAPAMMQNNEGTVRVSVTPRDLSKAAVEWRFDVRFNTHVTPITQDMMKATSLSGGKGAGEPPSAWNGDPPGGHHRRGVLVFKSIKPRPTRVTLHIREVGDVADRAFTWNLANQ